MGFRIFAKIFFAWPSSLTGSQLKWSFGSLEKEVVDFFDLVVGNLIRSRGLLQFFPLFPHPLRDTRPLTSPSGVALAVSVVLVVSLVLVVLVSRLFRVAAPSQLLFQCRL